MATIYTRRYYTPTEYECIANYDDGTRRVMAPHNEAEWIAKTGIVPAAESGDRFILIIGGVPQWDPNKAAILAAEAQAAADAAAAAQAEEARIQAKAQEIFDNLPAWQAIVDAIEAATTIAALKVIIKKMARVLYWLARDRAD